MTIYSFQDSDVFVNQIEAHPQFEVVMYKENTFINRRRGLGQSMTDGTISLFEVNVDRPANERINPFAPKDGSLTTLGTTNQADFASLEQGATVTGNYPLTGSVERELFTSRTATRQQRKDIAASVGFTGRFDDVAGQSQIIQLLNQKIAKEQKSVNKKKEEIKTNKTNLNLLDAALKKTDDRKES